MKININKSIIWVILLTMTACHKLEYLPADQLDISQVAGSPEGLQSILNGVYARLKQRNYVRHRVVMQEYPSDQEVWVKNSGDHSQQIYSYQCTVNNSVASQFWKQAYYGIYEANVLIAAIKDDAAKEQLQIKGEALFLRALMHYDLVRAFSRPYSQDPEKNLGVMIRDNTDVNALPPRSTVKDTYAFIEGDLLKAAELMTVHKPSIYASRETARALLARLYLYMGENDKAIQYADMVINSGQYHLLETEAFGAYFTQLPESNPETIFAIKLTENENMGKTAIGSLYTSDGGGWGEIMASPTYLRLIYKNKNDERIKFLNPVYVHDQSGQKIPSATEPSGYEVEKRDGYSKYYIEKYSNEGGIPLLSSPIVIRLAEMYLIKAEAYAKLGQDEDALDMVNLIRKRAGLSGDQLYTAGDLKGYPTVLDAVLGERNLELAWEGHRSFDLFRNGRSLDRSYVPAVGWSGPRGLIPPDARSIVIPIPEDEIALNPNLVQNPL
ncbi:RagB/SusD family nutrient uptake outer membrane protein [Compostibacter hankyongensis]|uniref:RagB/SusD family nutrient uptake outer membrane protein n=1 Tax=Compostibacter hankyongensis TaxID=1007089 RepID=A0ABP8FJJ0_9BACT